MKDIHTRTKYIGYVPSKGFIKKVNCVGSLVLTDNFYEARQYQNMGNFNEALRYIRKFNKDYVISVLEVEVQTSLERDQLFAAKLGFGRAEITSKQIRKEEEENEESRT